MNQDDILKESPIKLNTTSLSVLFEGMTDAFGRDKKVKLPTNVTELPKINIERGKKITEISLDMSYFCYMIQVNERRL